MRYNVNIEDKYKNDNQAKEFPIIESRKGEGKLPPKTVGSGRPELKPVKQEAPQLIEEGFTSVY